MALKGTLKDFGIAEILQLIGQQAKSGVLHLDSSDDLIHIAIADGNIVRAESSGRKARERLGNMLVKAGIITADELAHALQEQKRSLRRLGDVLVQLNLVSKKDLCEMTALQTTETVFRLFHWKSGTYEFEPGDVEWDRETVTPLRAESVLMEGFRRVDEWPLIRQKIPSTAVTFERQRALGPAWVANRPERSGAAEQFEGFGHEPGKKQGDSGSLDTNERRCYELAQPGRTVERIVELSRLGEFETCKALLNLINLGYLAAIPPANRGAAIGAYAHNWKRRIRRGLTRVIATVATAAALAFIAYWASRHPPVSGREGTALRDNAAQRFLARYHMERLRGALEVYRLERGEYPRELAQLVDAGLASGGDLSYPWGQEYYYRRRPEGRFVLLSPVE